MNPQPNFSIDKEEASPSCGAAFLWLVIFLLNDFKNRIAHKWIGKTCYNITGRINKSYMYKISHCFSYWQEIYLYLLLTLNTVHLVMVVWDIFPFVDRKRSEENVNIDSLKLKKKNRLMKFIILLSNINI